MRVAIIHDDDDATRLFSYMLAESGHEVIWTSQNSSEGIVLAKNKQPDLILLKLILSGSSASETIRTIISDVENTTIVLINRSIKNHPGKVFDAMSAGALDAISEPSTDEPESMHEFKQKINNISKLHKSAHSRQKATPPIVEKDLPLVAIGSSTGGPAALVKVLSSFSSSTRAAIVVIQHMDNQFSRGMVKWLDEQTDIKVEIAKANQKPQAGIVYVAGTNDHLTLLKNGQFAYTEEPADYPYRPSVDVFFESAVTHWPNKIIGVLLTGMGRDGASGLLSLYNRDMLTIAQDQETSAVYGMPKAAAELNAAKQILPIGEIGDAINKALKSY